MSDGIANGIGNGKGNYLSPEYCALSPEPVGHLAYPTHVAPGAAMQSAGDGGGT